MGEDSESSIWVDCLSAPQLSKLELLEEFPSTHETVIGRKSVGPLPSSSRIRYVRLGLSDARC